MTQFSDPIGHTDQRPWGSYTILDQGEGFQIKRIIVQPEKRLSYQSHEKRTERWTCISGMLTVIIDDKRYTLEAGDTIGINKGQKHRAMNEGSQPTEFIEVQLGEYLGEDDIVRYEDDFGRI
jgi:mannose-6-phosphate isomerase-like protein (cupin superfamily)